MQLADLLKFNQIVIQCHDNPDADALASGYALYQYFCSNGKTPRFVYSGRFQIQKSNLMLMCEKLEIPIEYVETLEKPELLVMVDCQYNGGNVACFEADTVAVIDHHQISTTLPELSDVRSNLGSCATLLYDLLLQENFDLKSDTKLMTALYYGLMTDTNNFAELHHPLDKDLRDDANYEKSLITLFRNSNLSLEELEIAGEALLGYEYNEEFRYTVARAKPCDPNILGLISDMMLEVDSLDACLVYSVLPFGIKISVRSCVKEINAGELAEFLADGVGNGGGHFEKAGGFLQKELLPEDAESYVKNRMHTYFATTEIIDTDTYLADPTGASYYKKKAIPIGFVDPSSFLEVGTDVLIRTLEGDINIKVDADFYIMIGIKGEVYPMRKAKFASSYQILDAPYVFDVEYRPSIKSNETGAKIDLVPYAKACVPTGDVSILAKQIDHRVKVFTAWDKEKYMLGKPGDFMAIREDDLHDVYIIEQSIFYKTYELINN